MVKKRGLKLQLQELPKNKLFMLILIFVISSLIVVFAGDIVVREGDLTVDTNVLHVDSVNNRVGIGTTTPASIAGANPVLAISGDPAGIVLNDTRTNGQIWEIFPTLEGAISYLSFYDAKNAMNRLSITNQGRIGVGTVTPTHKLNVVGDANVTGTVYYGSLVAQSPHMLEADEIGYTRSCWYDSKGFWNLVWFEDGVMRIEKNSLECTKKYDDIQRMRVARNVCLERRLQFNEEDLSCF